MAANDTANNTPVLEEAYGKENMEEFYEKYQIVTEGDDLHMCFKYPDVTLKHFPKIEDLYSFFDYLSDEGINGIKEMKAFYYNVIKEYFLKSNVEKNKDWKEIEEIKEEDAEEDVSLDVLVRRMDGHIGGMNTGINTLSEEVMSMIRVSSEQNFEMQKTLQSITEILEEARNTKTPKKAEYDQIVALEKIIKEMMRKPKNERIRPNRFREFFENHSITKFSWFLIGIIVAFIGCFILFMIWR